MSWNGADRPAAPKQPPQYYLIEREVWDPRKGRWVVQTHKIRQYDKWTKPKRSRETPHAFHKEYIRLEQALVTIPSGTWPDLWLVTQGSWGAASLLNANDQIKLVGKLNEKLQGSDFNASVFLGEGHQTLNMLADSAIRLAKAGWHMRKGDFVGAVRALFEGTTRKPLKRHLTMKPFATDSAKNLANNWLELQYGWLPLLNDAEACAQSIAAYLNEPLRSTYRCSVRREVDITLSQVIFSETWTTPQTKSHRRSLIAIIAEKPTAIQQLGLLDPELVAWELMPFSFVADWFIPIGSWMEARAKASRLTGTFITTNKQWARAGPTLRNGKRATPSTYRQLIFDRAISTSLNVPMPEFKPLEKVASWKHCANAVALVTQVFTGQKVRSIG